MLAYLDEAEHALAERGRGMPMEEFMHSLSKVVRRVRRRDGGASLAGAGASTVTAAPGA